MKKELIIPSLAGAGIVWASTAYHYINTGESIAWIIFALFFLWTVYKKEVAWHARLPKPLWTALGVFYGGLLLTTLCHLDNLDNLAGGYYSWTVFLRYTFSLWALLYIGWTRDIRKALFWTLTGITYAICLTALYQGLFLGIPPHSLYRTPHVTTMMIDLLCPVMVGMGWYYRSERLYKIVSWAAVPLQLVVLFLCKVRGADLAFAGALAVCFLTWIFLGHRKHVWKKVLVAMVGIGLIAAIGIGHTVSPASDGGIAVRGGGDRVYMWSAAYEIWKDNPVTGVGLNEWMSTYESPEYYPEGAREKGHDHPHNVFVYFFATGGAIGGASYIFYCLGIAGYFTRQIRKNPKDEIAWAMLFAFCAMIIHGFVDCNFIFKLVGRSFYMLLGVALLFSHWRERDAVRK